MSAKIKILLSALILVIMAAHQGFCGTKKRVAQARPNLKWLPARCRPRTVRYDHCGRRCYCYYPGYWRCCRIRRDFRDMGFFRRWRYIRTIKKASTDPLYKASYDALIKEHRDLFNTGIHQKDHFLPWHRDYILRYENLMRQIDCRFTVAYWDWSRDGSPWVGFPWGTVSPARFGPDGSGSNNCVAQGPFRDSQWKLTPSAGEGCLRRNFNGNPLDTVAVMELLNTPAAQFDDFEFDLRVIFHNSVHCLIDGTMCSIDAANAPEFFLHHGFIDKIWEDWQKKSFAHRYAHFPTVAGFMPGTTRFPKDLLRLKKQPGNVCVKYAEAPGRRRILNKLRRKSLRQLKATCNRRAISLVSSKAMRLFRVSSSDKRKIRKRERAFQPRKCTKRRG